MNMAYEMSETPLFGGCLLADSGSFYWDHDTGSDLNGLLSYDVNKIPQTLDTDPNSPFSTQSGEGDDKVDLSVLESMIDSDFMTSFMEPVPSPSEKSSLSPDSPLSPESGVWSPVSNANAESYVDQLSPLPTAAGITNDIQLPVDNQTDLILQELLFMNNEPVTQEQNVEIVSSQTIQVPLCTTGTTTIKTIPESNLNVRLYGENGQEIVQPFTLSTEPPVPIKPSGKKSKLKTLTLDDRKKRKRDQNKNAATRYREKKRNEENILKAELSGLTETNKNLCDKEAQVSREIQYLRELLLEVYKTKGLIE